MIKPFLETWSVAPDDPEIVYVMRNESVAAYGMGGRFRADGETDADAAQRATLASAAPAMVRALLIAEWSKVTYPRMDGSTDSYSECADCDRRRSDGHEPNCLVDVALTAAGLPDQASRDAARTELDDWSRGT